MAHILLGTSVSGRRGAAAREAPAQASLAALVDAAIQRDVFRAPCLAADAADAARAAWWRARQVFGA